MSSSPNPSVAPVFNVRTFGATGDGTTLDTSAINAAIEAAASAGGGTVWLPAGTFASHSIRLKSHVALYLDAGCTLLAAEPAAIGATDAPGYDPAEPNVWGDEHRYQDFGHSHWHNSLIWGEDLEDVSITGPGLIYGLGLTRGGSTRPGLANKAIALKRCRNVILRDFSMLQGGHFAILATGVDNLTIHNLKVDTNRDGFDIDACRHVRISDCTVNAPSDDAIVIKASYALGELRPCENITITGCQVCGYNAGTLLDGTFLRTQERAPDQDGPTGRIKIGTESNGDFRNITITNCVFDRSRGLALETVDGATIEDIAISNITMRDITNAPLFLRIGNRARGPAGTKVGAIRRVRISDLVVSGADARYASIIAGLPGHPVEDVVLSDISILYQGGLSLEHARRQPVAMTNRFFLRGSPDIPSPRDPFAVPELEKAYSEPCTFGILPAYGLWARHARDVTAHDVRVGFEAEDTRPAVVLEDVDGADFHRFRAQRGTGAATFVVRGARDVAVTACPGVPDTKREAVDDETW